LRYTHRKNLAGVTRVATIIIVVVVLVIAAVAAVFAYTSYFGPSGNNSGVSPFRIGYIGEGGTTTTWNEANLLGLRQAISELNSSSKPITLSVSASVPYDPTDMANALSAFTQANYSLIIFELTAFYPQLEAAAAANPHILFLGNSLPSANTTANLSTFGWNTWQGEYPAGIVAGMMTKSNTIGFITAFWFKQTSESYNAFAAGAKSVNPNIKVLSAVTSSWGDPTTGAAAASAMVSSSADVIVGVGDGMTDGIIKQAQTSGIYSMGYLFNESALAPRAVLCSVIWNTTQYYYSALSAASSGNFGHNDWEYGITQHIVGLQLTPLVPSNVASKVNQTLTQIYSGTLSVPDNSTAP
jgi:basic membrane protein A and related proteins